MPGQSRGEAVYKSAGQFLPSASCGRSLLNSSKKVSNLGRLLQNVGAGGPGSLLFEATRWF
jgi:hypothetical protein